MLQVKSGTSKNRPETWEAQQLGKKCGVDKKASIRFAITMTAKEKEKLTENKSHLRKTYVKMPARELCIDRLSEFH